MRTIGFSKLISKSIERTMLILFKPFRWKKWLKLIFIAWLAGALYSSGCNGGGGGDDYSQEAEAKESRMMQDPALTPPMSIQEGNNMPIYSPEDYSQQFPNGMPEENTQGSENWESWTPEPLDDYPEEWDPVVIGVIMVIIFICIIPLLILLTWISSRFKFIWFNAIVNNVADIGEPWHKYKTSGNSYFLGSLVIGMFIIIIYGLFALWAYLIFSSNVFAEGTQWSFGLVMQHFALPIITLLAFFVIGAALTVFLDHIVPTVMAMDESRFMEGWRKSWGIYTANKGDCWKYLLLLIGLGIITSIGLMLATIVVLLVLLLVAAIIFGIPALLFLYLLKMELVFGIIAVILGIPFLIIVIIMMMAVELPVSVFYRNLAYYFLASLDCGYAPIPLEEEPDS